MNQETIFVRVACVYINGLRNVNGLRNFILGPDCSLPIIEDELVL